MDIRRPELNYKRSYYPNTEYELIQGQGIVDGKLIGGHTGIANISNELIELSGKDFDDSILFIEDIPEFLTVENMANFLNLPVLYGLNFGHSSPTFILPYNARAKINCEQKSFTILESGVI